jgi:hypothetical protein
MDHDQRFKALVREFFPDFLRLFFPQWAERFNLSQPEWLDKELLPDPPDGDRHLLDLVARLRTTQPLGGENEEWIALVHIEIESSDRTTLLKPRLPRYWFHLSDREQRPVLPIVLYLRVGMEGIGVDTVEEYVGDFNVMTFRYHYVGLPALDAVQYAEGENLLGVALASLMQSAKESRAMLGADSLVRFGQANLTDYQRFLLSECVYAYLPLDEEGRQLFERITAVEPYSKIIPRNKTPYDFGLEDGVRKGARLLAIALLESKFRAVPQTFLDRIEKLSQPELQVLAIKTPTAATIEELFPDA